MAKWSFSRYVTTSCAATGMGLNIAAVQLGLQSAPVVYVYPPTEGDHKVVNPKSPFIKYDFSKSVSNPLHSSMY
jgi:hypothetical protein